MSVSIRIKSIKLVNFIGIKTGLGKKELEIDFKKFNDKNIILILGDNGTGKSTFMSVLHPFPGTTDDRQKFIIPDKEGIKKIVYDRSDGYRIECKIVYSPSKTGHNCKGFIHKISPNGDEIDLNENGNITSYKDCVTEELGMTDSMLKLSSQNDVSKGLIAMTSTERKVNINSFLPDDIYSSFYNVADKIYKELKTRINILVESIGKLHNEDTLTLELEKVTKKINDLVEKRDKCTSKIASLKTRIEVIQESGIETKNKDLKRDIKESYQSMEHLQEKIDDIYFKSSLGTFLTRDSSPDRIQAAIDDAKNKLKDNEIKFGILSSKLEELKLKRSSITEQINSKRNSISDIESEHSLSELKTILKDYEEQTSELSKSAKKIPVGVTKDTFMTGYEIVNIVRRGVSQFADYDYDLVRAICNDEFKDYRRDELLLRRKTLTDEMSELSGKIAAIDSDSNSDSILQKRPANCEIDNCPFIATAYRLKKIQEKLPEYITRIKSIQSEILSIDNKLEKADEMKHITDNINSLYSYIASNSATISKLPYSNEYSTMDALKKCILNRGSNLSKCDDFEKYIEAIEDCEELTKLITITIPQVKHEIEMLETKGKFIESTRDELRSLELSKTSVNDDISRTDSQLHVVQCDIESLVSSIDALSNLYEKKTEHDAVYTRILNDDMQLKEISSQIEEIEEYRSRIDEKKERLAEIDSELSPLTRQREIYKTEQLKIASFKDELAVVNQDLFKCEIVRASLSVKDDGIPISALSWWLDVVRQNANALLAKTFNGNMFLDEFIINSKDFMMPYHKNGQYGLDVSYSSSSERSFISLCITMAIIEETVSKYTICTLDEIDRGMSEANKSIFIDVLFESCHRAGITQLFMITHNANYYRGYSDVGYILFPGSEDLGINDDESITISEEE